MVKILSEVITLCTIQKVGNSLADGFTALLTFSELFMLSDLDD